VRGGLPPGGSGGSRAAFFLPAPPPPPATPLTPTPLAAQPAPVLLRPETLQVDRLFAAHQEGRSVTSPRWHHDGSEAGNLTELPELVGIGPGSPRPFPATPHAEARARFGLVKTYP